MAVALEKESQDPTSDANNTLGTVEATGPPAPKRFKSAPRRLPPSNSSQILTTPASVPNHEVDLARYLVEAESLGEETKVLEYWDSKKSVYPTIAKAALNLVSAPASQAYVERIFSLCGELSARKRNRAKVTLESRVFLKMNYRELNKVNKS